MRDVRVFIYFCDFECGDVLIFRFSFWFRLFDSSTGERKYWMIQTHRCINTHTLRLSFVYINSKIKSMSLEVVAFATNINTEIILLFLFQLRVIRPINDLSVFVSPQIVMKLEASSRTNTLQLLFTFNFRRRHPFRTIINSVSVFPVGNSMMTTNVWANSCIQLNKEQFM